LDATVDFLFADAAPEGCPDDPIEKQRHLAAHALTRLVLDSTVGSRPGRGEFVAVIDADVTAVVVRNGIVLHAPGELNLGRTTRLANRAQRRALRSLYSTCAIPDCRVGDDCCKLHHIIWWTNDGPTDLDNLLPVCTVHHHNIHHDGWTVELGPNRELTLTLPDSTIHTTGPPNRRTAA
jgi:hypothetical protein